MHTERLLLETDKAGNLKGVPKFPPNKQVEAIFLVMDTPRQKTCSCRSPHLDIAGKTQILGNIFDSAPDSDWNLSQ